MSAAEHRLLGIRSEESCRVRHGGEAGSVPGLGRMSPRLVGCRQMRWRWWALWLAIGITIDPAHLRAQCAQEDPPSSSGTTIVEIEVKGTAASGTKSFAIIDGRLTFERSDTVCYELQASVHGRYGKSGGEVMANDWGVETSFDATPGVTFRRSRLEVSSRTRFASCRYGRGWGLAPNG